MISLMTLAMEQALGHFCGDYWGKSLVVVRNDQCCGNCACLNDCRGHKKRQSLDVWFLEVC